MSQCIRCTLSSLLNSIITKNNYFPNIRHGREDLCTIYRQSTKKLFHLFYRRTYRMLGFFNIQKRSNYFNITKNRRSGFFSPSHSFIHKDKILLFVDELLVVVSFTMLNQIFRNLIFFHNFFLVIVCLEIERIDFTDFMCLGLSLLFLKEYTELCNKSLRADL